MSPIKLRDITALEQLSRRRFTRWEVGFIMAADARVMSIITAKRPQE